MRKRRELKIGIDKKIEKDRRCGTWSEAIRKENRLFA